MSTDPLEILQVKSPESVKDGQSPNKIKPFESLNAPHSTNPDSKPSIREDASFSSNQKPDSKSASSTIVAIIGLLCILVSVVFGIRSIERERSDADFQLKATAHYMPTTADGLLKMLGEEGTRKGYALYRKELEDNRSKMYQSGIAGVILIFISYFMHHAAKISRALPSASGIEKSAAERLVELQKLVDQGLISTDEYTRRRSEIINST